MKPLHSLEAEQSVLGGLMLDNSAWDHIADRVSEQDFSTDQHRAIFRAMSTLAESGKPLDVVTVSEKTGDLSYLATLAQETPSAANIKAYADIVRDRAMLRGLVSAAGRIAELPSANEPTAELIDRAMAMLTDLAMTRAGELEPVGASLTAWIDELDARLHRDGKLLGIPTGIPDLDNRLSGLCAGDLIIVAGRPSMGKSALAFQFAANAAVNHKLPAALFSLEMPVTQILDRMVAQLGRMDFSGIRTGDTDYSKVSGLVARLKDAPLYLDESSGLSALDIRARARRLHRKTPLSLVVVDYLQLMTHPKGDTQALSIGETTRSLKALAKELRCPVVLLSQLSREVEKRGSKRPQMSDLRDSGAIEADADVVLFPFRPEVYDENNPRLSGIAEIITAKQRNGVIGTDVCAWLGQHQRFDALDHHAIKAYRQRDEKPKVRGFDADRRYADA